MSDQKYEFFKRETLFQGYFRVDRYHLRHEKIEGGWTPIFTREVLNKGTDASGVLLFDPLADKVALVEQFRATVFAAGEDPWSLEIVAGAIDPGETAEEAARRESLEEACCKVTDLCPITEVFTNAGMTNEKIYLYVGRTTFTDIKTIGGLENENEETRVHVMSTSEALNLLYAKKIRHASAYITLQWFALHHTELRSRWLISNASTPLI